MTQPAPPVAAAGRVIRDGETSFLPETCIHMSIEQAGKKSPDGKDLLWTCDVEEELPIKLSKSGIGAAPPVTIIESFAETVRKYRHKPALAYKPPSQSTGKFRIFNWQSYWNECCRFAKAIISVGHKSRDRVLIMGYNSAFWHIAHFGTMFANGVAGSIYATNGVEATEYILYQSEAVVVVVDDIINMEKIVAAKRMGRCPNLKNIVMYMEDPPEGSSAHNAWRWEDFLRLGQGVPDGELTDRMESAKPGLCCELVYTSGTTGVPKAVMLSHDNCIWTSFSLLQMVLFTSDERVVSFLPLSHIAPQIIDLYIPILTGCCTYFAQPDALRGSLLVTLQEVRPTFFFAVPRVYEKFEERIRAVGTKNTGLKKRIAEWAKSIGFRGTMNILNGESPPYGYSIINSAIFGRIRAAIGLDMCKAMASGAAPLSGTTRDYFLSFGMPICDMYGMSESTGPQTSNAAWPGWFKRGTAGVSLPGTEIIIDRPSEDGIGEICYRSRNLFMGYFKDEESTRKTIDSYGFLHSGDIGFVDNDGFLTVTGRIKELLITAGGENIPPVSIESSLQSELPFVSNCMVIGDGRKYLTVLICLRSEADVSGAPTNKLAEELLSILQLKGSKSRTIFEATNDTVLHDIITEGIKKVNKRAISRAQHIQKFRIVPQDFTQDGGELTPTLKLKRTVVANKYSALIESMYSDDDVNDPEIESENNRAEKGKPQNISKL